MNLLLPNYMIAVFVMLFACTFLDILRRDTYFGGAYFALFIYIIFVQIGYANFPEVSQFIKAYFGMDIFPSFMSFITLSFIGFYCMFRCLYSQLSRFTIIVKTRSAGHPPWFFLLLVSMHLIYLALYFALNGDQLNYITASNADFAKDQGALFVIFGILFKTSVTVILVLYTSIRMRVDLRGQFNVRGFSLLLVLEIVSLVVIATRLGNRTDILALFIGILLFETKFREVTLRRVLVFCLATLVVVWGMRFIFAGRSEGGNLEVNQAQAILFQDYYGPGHILLAAMSLHWVNLWEVVKSNFCNSLILLNYPYLQAPITDLFNPGVASRSTGYAFYVFTEGFLAFGWFGWIYNAIVVFSGYSLWRLMAQSENRPYRLFAFSLLGSMLFNSVRGQSSYFFKCGYTFFIPAFILFFLATGIRPSKLCIQSRKPGVPLS